MLRKFLLVIFILIFVFTNFSSVLAQNLTLKSIVKLTLKNYPKIKSLKEKIKAEILEKKSVAIQRAPKIKTFFQFQRFNQPMTLVPISKPGTFPPFTKEIYSWEIQVSFPIYLGGLISKQVKNKELQIKTSYLDLTLTKEQVIASVKLLYFQLLYYKSLISTLKKLLKSLKLQRDLAKLRYEQGKIPKLDILHFNEQIQEQKALLNSCKQNFIYTKKLLGLFIGFPQGNFTISGNLTYFELPSTLYFPVNSFLNNRPDIQIAKIKLKQSQTSLELVKHEFYPKIYAFSSYGYRYSSGLNDDSKLWSIGIRLEFDIFDSGVRIYRLFEKQKRISEARYELNSLILKAKQEIINAIKGINQTLSQIDSLKAAIKFAKESYKVEAIRYKEGAGSITDLLLAQQALLNVRIKLLKAYFDLQMAIVNYELATGYILKEVKP